MFQETIQVATQPGTIEKAINFGAVGANLGLILLGMALLLSGYAFKTKDTPVATLPWIRQNVRRFVAGGVLVLALSIAMVAVPDQLGAVFSLLAIDVKNVMAPFTIGLGLGFLLISVTSEPSKAPEGT